MGNGKKWEMGGADSGPVVDSGLGGQWIDGR